MSAGVVEATACPSWCRVDHEAARALEIQSASRRAEALDAEAMRAAVALADSYHNSDPRPERLATVQIDRVAGLRPVVWCMDLPMHGDLMDLRTARDALRWVGELADDLRNAIELLERIESGTD